MYNGAHSRDFRLHKPQDVLAIPGLDFKLELDKEMRGCMAGEREGRLKGPTVTRVSSAQSAAKAAVQTQPKGRSLEHPPSTSVTPMWRALRTMRSLINTLSTSSIASPVSLCPGGPVCQAQAALRAHVYLPDSPHLL